MLNFFPVQLFFAGFLNPRSDVLEYKFGKGEAEGFQEEVMQHSKF